MSYNFDKLIKTLDSYLGIGVPFYDCVVMKDGECVFRHMNGFIDPERKVKPISPALPRCNYWKKVFSDSRIN